FTAPSTGTTVTMNVDVVIKAQSVGGKQNGNNGTILASAPIPVVTNVVPFGDKDDTYLRAGDAPAGTGKLSSTHPQNFSITLPGMLFGTPFGVAVSIHHKTRTALCGTRLTSWTTLRIPVAAFTTTAGNPFFDGTNVHAYSWSMTAQYPSNSKPTQIIHIDDNGVPQQLQKCIDIGGAPTAADPMCYDTFDPA